MPPVTYRVPKECSQYVSEIERYSWNTTIMVAIAFKESHCNPKAVNWNDHHKGCNGSFGITQNACLHYSKGQDRYDPKTSIQIAYRIYQEAKYSFSPWSTCKLVQGCV